MSRELVVLDIDRTLINTTNLSDMIIQPIAAVLQLSDTQIAMMLAAISEREGKVFDYLKWLPKAMELDSHQLKLLDDADALTHAILQFYAADGVLAVQFIEKILIPGAPELLKAVKESGSKVLLLTAGGKVLQSIKVALVQAMTRQVTGDVGVTDAIIISTHVAKAELINTCFTADGFSIDLLCDEALVSTITNPHDYAHIEHVTIVDDKYANLVPSGDRVAGVPVYIEGDPDKTEPDEARYRTLGLPVRHGLIEIAKYFKTVSQI